MVVEQPELVVADVAAWKAWLAEHHQEQLGVWLLLARKGTTQPTSLTYAEALQEALCQGWIDGQARRRDDATYFQRFTPRRARSPWSKRNVGLRGRPRGVGPHAAGRPGRGRAGQGRRPLGGRLRRPGHHRGARRPRRRAGGRARRRRQVRDPHQTNRYAILYRVQDAKRPDTRARRIEQFVAMLERGETVHPQKRALER